MNDFSRRPNTGFFPKILRAIWFCRYYGWVYFLASPIYIAPRILGLHVTSWRPCWWIVLDTNMAAMSLYFESPGIDCKPSIALFWHIYYAMSYKITFTRGKVDEVVTVARPGAMAVYSDVQSLKSAVSRCISHEYCTAFGSFNFLCV